MRQQVVDLSGGMCRQPLKDVLHVPVRIVSVDARRLATADQCTTGSRRTAGPV